LILLFFSLLVFGGRTKNAETVKVLAALYFDSNQSDPIRFRPSRGRQTVTDFTPVNKVSGFES
jgi:hypothetical protein